MVTNFTDVNKTSIYLSPEIMESWNTKNDHEIHTTHAERSQGPGLKQVLHVAVTSRQMGYQPSHY